MILHRGLPLGNRLRHIPGVPETATRCPACLNHQQTHEHLFAECPMTSVVWRRLFQLAQSTFEIRTIPPLALSFDLVMRGIPAIPQSAPQFATPWTTMVALMLRSLWLVRNDNSFKQVCLTSELVWARFKTEHLNTLKAVCRKSSLSTALRNSCKRTWGNRNRLINFPPTGRPLIGEINRLLSFSPQHAV